MSETGVARAAVVRFSLIYSHCGRELHGTEGSGASAETRQHGHHPSGCQRSAAACLVRGTHLPTWTDACRSFYSGWCRRVLLLGANTQAGTGAWVPQGVSASVNALGLGLQTRARSRDHCFQKSADMQCSPPLLCWSCVLCPSVPPGRQADPSSPGVSDSAEPAHPARHLPFPSP